jgi:peptidoglycan hydrolase-like protein with peptidoglycan-binding domain
VLIESGLLHGEADGVLGQQTREAIITYQRQQGIEVTGSIDARTVSTLGVSGRLSQQANQSLGQPQSSKGAQTLSTTGSHASTTGQAATGLAQTDQQQPKNASGQLPNQSTGQAPNAPAQQNQPSPTWARARLQISRTRRDKPRRRPGEISRRLARTRRQDTCRARQ